ncbi:IS200/IS605 family accessory protein TnpB-related protein, partial [Streptomyces sp. NPDC058000]
LDVERGRWYLTASWTRPVVKTVPLDAARAKGMVGMDTNADHFAAYLLDGHGNPVGEPRRFSYDLSGSADHRDAQIRHALTRLLHWTKQAGAKAIGIENLDFATEKTREKHGRRKRFRQLISGMPTGKLKARIVSMAAEQGLAIVAVDPAYTSMWGDEHWRKPLTSNKRKMSRHDAAGIAIGRRALGHPIRRRTAPPQHHQSDGAGHRTAQAEPVVLGSEEPRHPATDRSQELRARAEGTRTRATSRTSKTVRDVRSDQVRVQDSLLIT